MSDVKQNIIETASKLFYNNGYNSTGINEVIEKAGIAKATLYNHFKSKEELCVSYLKYMNSNFLSDIVSYCNSKPKGKPQVLAVFDFLQEFFIDKEFNGCWCIKTVAEIPRDNTLIRNEIQNQKKAFIHIISQIVKANIKRKTDIAYSSIAKQIYLLYEGAVGESHLLQKDWPITEARIICSKLI
jgi:AcrR family transcriptional regulator